MGLRRRGRECAVQILYQMDVLSGEVEEVLSDYWAERQADPRLLEFVAGLVRGTAQYRNEIDDLLSSSSDNWSLTRMSIVDRNILRLAAYELRYRPEIPVKVTINEAIEIAKRFGGDDSAHFVNGVLDRIKRDLERAVVSKER